MTNLHKQGVVPPSPAYREISLTQGKVALVDAEDYERISRHKWHAWKSKGSNPVRYYARRNVRLPCGKKTGTYMHREVMGLVPGDPKEIDHRKRIETLDNRKENLRISTHSENMFNKVAQSNNTSGHKGVSLINSTGMWNVKIKAFGVSEHVGNFALYEAACAAYRKRSRELHGEFSTAGKD